MKSALIVVMFFPFFAFCWAGFIEMGSGRRSSEKLRSLVPVAFGIAAFGLLLDPAGLLNLTPQSSATLGRWMTFGSAVIACSGVFISFAKRTSALWVACGGLVLTLFWMFNRTVV